MSDQPDPRTAQDDDPHAGTDPVATPLPKGRPLISTSPWGAGGLQDPREWARQHVGGPPDGTSEQSPASARPAWAGTPAEASGSTSTAASADPAEPGNGFAARPNPFAVKPRRSQSAPPVDPRAQPRVEPSAAGPAAGQSWPTIPAGPARVQDPYSRLRPTGEPGPAPVGPSTPTHQAPGPAPTQSAPSQSAPSQPAPSQQQAPRSAPEEAHVRTVLQPHPSAPSHPARAVAADQTGPYPTPGYAQPLPTRHSVQQQGQAAPAHAYPSSRSPQYPPASYAAIPTQPGTVPPPPASVQPQPTQPQPTQPRSYSAGELINQLNPEGDHRARRGLRARLGLKPSVRELAEIADEERARAAFSRPVTIMVANPKGGVGKTPTTLLLAAAFGTARGGGVVAWDNNELRGTMPDRSFSPHRKTVRDLLDAHHRLSAPQSPFTDLAQFLNHQTTGKFYTLGSAQTSGHVISSDDFEQIHGTLSRYFQIILVDTGNNEASPNWLAAAAAADCLVVPTKWRKDSLIPAARMLETLQEYSRDLLNRTVVVATNGPADSQEAVKRSGSSWFDSSHTILEIPTDPHVAEGGVIDWAKLAPRTRRASLSLAAQVADRIRPMAG